MSKNEKYYKFEKNAQNRENSSNEQNQYKWQISTIINQAYAVPNRKMAKINSGHATKVKMTILNKNEEIDKIVKYRQNR